MTIELTNNKDLIGIKKPQLHLVPPSSKIYEALALEDGAKKYGAYNWRDNKVLLSIYIAAIQRHVDQFWDGEDYAEDSGVHHLAHAKACLGIVLDSLELNNIIDDRPTKGTASKLLSQHTKKGKE